tara:strand:+ start:349 stop:525 length:177 start_codon:yes stop_codon:yes gene_type:complete
MSKITKEMCKYYVPRGLPSDEYEEYFADILFRLLNDEVSVEELKKECKVMWDDKESEQ